VDTSKAAVARQVLAAGAAIINDVTALHGDPDMPAAVRETGAGAILMHMRGTPATMQQAPSTPKASSLPWTTSSNPACRTCQGWV